MMDSQYYNTNPDFDSSDPDSGSPSGPVEDKWPSVLSDDDAPRTEYEQCIQDMEKAATATLTGAEGLTLESLRITSGVDEADSSEEHEGDDEDDSLDEPMYSDAGSLQERMVWLGARVGVEEPWDASPELVQAFHTDILNAVVEGRDIDLVRCAWGDLSYLCKTSARPDSALLEIGPAAVRGGSVAVLKFLKEQGCILGSVLMYARMLGRTKVVAWLVAEEQVGRTELIDYWVAQQDQIELCSWVDDAQDKLSPEEFSSVMAHVYCAACVFANAEVVAATLSLVNGDDRLCIAQYLLYDAIMSTDISTVRAAINGGAYPDDRCIPCAVQTGNVDLLSAVGEYVSPEHTEISPDICSAAVLSGSIAVLEWVRARRPSQWNYAPLPVPCMEDIVQVNEVEMSGCGGETTQIGKLPHNILATPNLPKICDWLDEHGLGIPDFMLPSLVAQGHLDAADRLEYIVRWRPTPLGDQVFAWLCLTKSPLELQNLMMRYRIEVSWVDVLNKIIPRAPYEVLAFVLSVWGNIVGLYNVDYMLLSDYHIGLLNRRGDASITAQLVKNRFVSPVDLIWEQMKHGGTVRYATELERLLPPRGAMA